MTSSFASLDVLVRITRRWNPAEAAAEAAAGDESAMHFDGPSSTMDSCPSAFDGMVFDVPSQGCFDGQMGFDGGFDGPMRFDGAQEGCFNGPMAFDGPVPHGDPVVGFDAHPYAGPCGAHGAHGAAHAYGGHPMSYDAQPFEAESRGTWCFGCCGVVLMKEQLYIITHLCN